MSQRTLVASSSEQLPPLKKKMFKNCDFCRSAKRACDANYTSISQALASKVACTNCKRKKRTCTFNHLISTFGVADIDFSAARANATATEIRNATEPDEPCRKRRRDNEPEGYDQVVDGNNERFVVRLSPSAASRPPGSAIGFDATETRITANLDRAFLNDDLISIYEGAAEQALRCWVTNANTPYLFELDGRQGPWTDKTLHWRVCALDREARNFTRGSPLQASSDKLIHEAFHAVMLAFAAQWPRHRKRIGEHSNLRPQDWQPDEARIRLELWKQARDKLMAASDTWSFRIIFALILFAWTEKPKEVPSDAHWQTDDASRSLVQAALYENSAVETSSWQNPAEASTMMLATAGRKLLQFRNRLQSLCRRGVDPWSIGASTTRATSGETEAAQMQRRRLEASLLEKTYHNLFWLGVMIDTETAVLRKHPPVICDDDTDLVQQSLLSNLPGFSSDGPVTRPLVPSHSPPHSQGQGRFRKIWDDVILSSSEQRKGTFARVWPSSEEAALRTLAFSAPVKVLLFRHIGRLQAAYWRQAEADVIERHIQQGLAVVYHWALVYQPFLESCISHHTALPPSIQSWYTLITVPWNLAVLLLVELAQTVDQACLSDPQERCIREQGDTFSTLRRKACNQTAALIHAVQSHERQRPPNVEHKVGTEAFSFVHSAGGTILHTEPWAEIMVCAFSAVAKSEIRMFAGLAAHFQWQELGCAKHRVEKYLWALNQLSNRSHLAELAYQETKAMADFCSPEGSVGGAAFIPAAEPAPYPAPPASRSAPYVAPPPAHTSSGPGFDESMEAVSPNTQLWQDCLAVLSDPCPTSTISSSDFLDPAPPHATSSSTRLPPSGLTGSNNSPDSRVSSLISPAFHSDTSASLSGLATGSDPPTTSHDHPRFDYPDTWTDSDFSTSYASVHPTAASATHRRLQRSPSDALDPGGSGSIASFYATYPPVESNEPASTAATYA